MTKQQVIQCNYCEGRGTSPQRMNLQWELFQWHATYPCQMCNGKGLIRIEYDDQLVPHAPCHGTGRRIDSGAGFPSTKGEFYYVSMSVCNDCHGLGLVSLTGRVRKVS